MTISAKGDHRPEDDHEQHQQPRGRGALGEVAEERDRVVEPLERELHRGCTIAQKSAAKKKPQSQSDTGSRRVTSRSAIRMYARVRHAGAEGSGDPDAVERESLPDLDDQREPGEGEAERQPDASPHALVQDVPRPERDEQRREVLDQQRDAHRQPVDREEIEPLHERDAGDAEDGEEQELSPA